MTLEQEPPASQSSAAPEPLPDRVVAELARGENARYLFGMLIDKLYANLDPTTLQTVQQAVVDEAVDGWKVALACRAMYRKEMDKRTATQDPPSSQSIDGVFDDLNISEALKAKVQQKLAEDNEGEDSDSATEESELEDDPEPIQPTPAPAKGKQPAVQKKTPAPAVQQKKKQQQNTQKPTTVKRTAKKRTIPASSDSEPPSKGGKDDMIISDEEGSVDSARTVLGKKSTNSTASSGASRQSRSASASSSKATSRSKPASTSSTASAPATGSKSTKQKEDEQSRKRSKTR